MKIHVVSLTIPWPPNYGGAIDIFYKLKSLHKLGVQIHLHCYKYDRDETEELKKYCYKVSYYDRRLKIIDTLSLTPFIVKSRVNKKLVDELNKDNNKILIEGVHGFSIYKYVDNNRIYIRTHNVEQDYYWALMKASNSYHKKFYYWTEFLKLRNYENKLKKAKGVLCISPNDLALFEKINKNSVLISPFHEHEYINCDAGLGEYILLHGNLQVEENIKSIKYLINNVLNKIDHKVIIAGRQPDESIIKLCEHHQHIMLVSNPSQNEMIQLIKGSQIILLHTFQSTGIKLKLVNSLYLGRHVICNSLMVDNTNLNQLVYIANNDRMWINTINQLMTKTFTKQNANDRQVVLEQFYNNKINAKRIISILQKTN